MPGGMADLTALMLLVATGWWDGWLRRAGIRRGAALAALALILAAACANVGFDAGVPVRLNLGGVLPAAALAVAARAAPARSTRLLAATGVAACFLFGLGGWSGPASAVALPGLAGLAAVMVAGPGPESLLAAAAAPAVADVARWALAWGDGLPGTVWVGGGSSFATAVLAATAAGLILAGRTLLAWRPARQAAWGRRRPLG
jgi:hypothetical protein